MNFLAKLAHAACLSFNRWFLLPCLVHDNDAADLFGFFWISLLMEPLNIKTDAPHAALSSYVMCRCDVLKGTCERLAEVFDRIKDENEMMVSSFAAIWDKSCAATGEMHWQT